MNGLRAVTLGGGLVASLISCGGGTGRTGTDGGATVTSGQVKDASGIRQGDLVQVDGNGNIARIQ